MSQKEVDETDGTLIDAYMIFLEAIRDSSGGKKQRDVVERALLG